METAELACTYSALILKDGDSEVTSDKITSMLKAANVSVDKLWPALFTKALEGVDLDSLIKNLSSGIGSGPAPAAAAAGGGGGSGAAKEEKKEEKKEESEEEEDDMGFGLFD